MLYEGEKESRKMIQYFQIKLLEITWLTPFSLLQFVSLSPLPSSHLVSSHLVFPSISFSPRSSRLVLSLLIYLRYTHIVSSLLISFPLHSISSRPVSSCLICFHLTLSCFYSSSPLFSSLLSFYLISSLIVLSLLISPCLLSSPLLLYHLILSGFFSTCLLSSNLFLSALSSFLFLSYLVGLY